MTLLTDGLSFGPYVDAGGQGWVYPEQVDDDGYIIEVDEGWECPTCGSDALLVYSEIRNRSWIEDPGHDLECRTRLGVVPLPYEAITEHVRCAGLFESWSTRVPAKLVRGDDRRGFGAVPIVAPIAFALRHPCSHCKAEPRYPCRDRRRGQPSYATTIHAARYDAGYRDHTKAHNDWVRAWENRYYAELQRRTVVYGAGGALIDVENPA